MKTTALVLALTLGAMTAASADDAIVTIPSCVIGWGNEGISCTPPVVSTPAQPSVALRVTEYVFEGADAIVSGSHTAHFPGNQSAEINPSTRLFSHGGSLMYLAGYAIGDVLIGAFTRRFRPSQKNALAAAQILSDGYGLEFTSNGQKGKH